MLEESMKRGFVSDMSTEGKPWVIRPAKEEEVEKYPQDAAWIDRDTRELVYSPELLDHPNFPEILRHELGHIKFWDDWLYEETRGMEGKEWEDFKRSHPTVLDEEDIYAELLAIYHSLGIDPDDEVAKRKLRLERRRAKKLGLSPSVLGKMESKARLVCWERA